MLLSFSYNARGGTGIYNRNVIRVKVHQWMQKFKVHVACALHACPRAIRGFSWSSAEGEGDEPVDMSVTSLDLSDGDVAEPFRFNFEIAWEVANKGTSQCLHASSPRPPLEGETGDSACSTDLVVWVERFFRIFSRDLLLSKVYVLTPHLYSPCPCW